MLHDPVSRSFPTKHSQAIVERPPAHGIGCAISMRTHVRRGDNLGQREQGVILAGRFLSERIQGCAFQTAALQRREKRVLVNQLSPRSVNEESARLHPRQE